MADRRDSKLTKRQRHEIQGIVQGVGFRPFVYRLAHELDLSGWVRNTPAGVELEIQGGTSALETFNELLRTTLPPLALITSHQCTDIPVNDHQTFTILQSGSGTADIQIAPDSALCTDCLRELFDPADRRFRYPFITCTNCGPRYSIITGIPYDRPATTMTGFHLCPDCLREYQEPLDRRFHAQPIACHACGPRISLIVSGSLTLQAECDEAVIRAVELLKGGKILAAKGIGGYHLAVDACSNAAVQRLRERKKRDEKPFAVMAANLETARELALMSEVEERLLCSPEAPIIIVRKRPGTQLSTLIAPNNGWVGLMLPYAPLHHLLFRDNFTALVMTSGNISDEPVAFEDQDAFDRLAGIADYFLLHNRTIHIRSDDSVMRVFHGKPLFYRRSRGYAPRAVKLPFAVPPLLATGAELKNAICLADGERAVLSQHIGDLRNQATLDSFNHTIAHLSGLLEVKPALVACDLHPDYLSSRYAEESGLPLVMVQHHHAHLASCMAENGLDGDVIGIIFDGTGYGTDGTIWGGEFLVGGYGGFQRAGHFKPLPLPGGDAAVREPWRMAMSYLYQSLGEAAFAIDHPVARVLPEQERALFVRMLQRRINSPLTSSCGRLFDAVAALLNIRHMVSYDGQGAIELESLAEKIESEENEVKSPLIKGELEGFAFDSEIKSPPAPLSQRGGYHFNVECHENAPFQLDFSPMFTEILTDIADGIETSSIAWHFHKTVASATADACLHIAASAGLDRVVLSGGVFQNRLLSEMIYTALSDKGLTVFTHRLVPPNDGGIALGQAAIAGRRKV